MNDLLPVEFEKSLEDIPWFRNVGNLESLERVRSLKSWSEWPGPEDDRVLKIHLNQQALHDEILASNSLLSEELDALFERVRNRVVATTTKSLGITGDDDAWDARTTAAWHAGWTAGLVALCLATKQLIPANLQTQWTWFLRGHWPAMLDSSEATALIVY